jgi:hypothetical protein
MILASVLGDGIRLVGAGVAMTLILGFWYLFLSRLGSPIAVETTVGGAPEKSTQVRDDEIGDDRFRRFHRVVAWVLGIATIIMIGQISFLTLYIPIRFGWSR